MFVFLRLTKTSKILNKRFSTGTSSDQQLLKYSVNPLSETLERFKKTAQPLVTEKEFQKMISQVKIFCECEGVELQSLLKKQSELESNWLTKRWLRSVYLQYRDPLVAFSSPAIAFPIRKFSSDSECLWYAANLIFEMAYYKMLLDRKCIPIQKMGGLELDNSQYYKIFGTSRMPGCPEDTLQQCSKSNHIVVMYRNHVSNSHKLAKWIFKQVYSKEMC